MVKADKIISIFQGAGVSVEGIFQFESGTVKLNAGMKGQILAPKGTLIVGKMAQIEAEIRAGTIIVMGQIRGVIFAEKKVELYPPGCIVGNIQAPEILIAAGVTIQGTCCITS